MTFNKMGTLPLPLALHLATYTVIGLFCAFAGGLNLIDPTKIFPNAIIFLGLAGFSWGYVFGILMARKEVLGLGLVASIGYIVAGIWQLGPDRKSTRLNSSHANNSYAVFCLKKKNRQ